MDNVVDEIKVELTGEDKSASKTVDEAIQRLKSVADKNRSLWTDISKTSDSAISRIRKAVAPAANAVKGKLAGVGLAGVAAFNNIKNSAENNVGAVGRTISRIKSIVSPTANYIKNTFGQAFSAVSRTPTVLGKAASSGFGIAKASVTGFRKAANLVGPVLNKICSGLKLIGSAGKKVGGVIAKPFTALGKAAGGAVGKLGGLLSSFTRILKYRVIRGIIKSITDAFKEGTGNLYQYSKAVNGTFAQSMDKLSTSALYVKNSLGAIAAPIINAVAPAVEFLTDKFVDLINTVNETIASLTGAKTWTKAIKYPVEFAAANDEASKKTAKAAKKIKRSLLSIDEIHALSDNSDKGSSGNGSKKTDSKDYSKMFKQVETGTNPLTKIAKKLKNIFGGVFDVFQKAWNNKGKAVIDSVKSAFGNVKGLIGSIGKSFATVFKNGTGQKTIEHILGIFSNIFSIVGNLAGAIQRAWNTSGTGTRIVQSVWNIFNQVLGTIERITGATANWLKKLDLSPLMSAIATMTESLEPLATLILDTLADAYETVLLPLASWTIKKAAPVAVKTLTAAFKALHTILTPVIDGIKLLLNKLQPVFKFIGDVAISILNMFKSAFKKLAAVFKEKGDDIRNIFNAIGEVVSKVWKIVEPALKNIKNTVVSMFNTVVDFLSNRIKNIISYFSGLIDFIKGTFSGDWKKAWGGIKKMFKAVWDGFVNIVKLPVNIIFGVIEKFVNGVVGAVNLAIDGINTIHVDIPDWVPFVGGKKIGFDIPHIPQLTIKRLETGGFPEVGQAFIARENGPELVGTIGRKNAVVNNEQIVASVSKGVANANNSQNALLRETNRLLRLILAKDDPGGASVNTSDVIAAFQRKSRRDGKTIVPLGT